MSIIETIIDIPAEHERKVCGQFDSYLKKIERTLHVSMVARDGEIKVIGPDHAVKRAKSVFSTLLELSKRGEEIGEQNVDYALALSFEDKDTEMLSLDRDIICHTINGKPVKPKTLGQKQYIDLIRKKMIVFGVGPAGTGKTYLGMSMAIQAFKNGEVGRIILTRPAIEAGEKLGFLPGDLQSKIDPYLRPLYGGPRCDPRCGARHGPALQPLRPGIEDGPGGIKYHVGPGTQEKPGIKGAI